MQWYADLDMIQIMIDSQLRIQFVVWRYVTISSLFNKYVFAIIFEHIINTYNACIRHFFQFTSRTPHFSLVFFFCLFFFYDFYVAFLFRNIFQDHLKIFWNKNAMYSEGKHYNLTHDLLMSNLLLYFHFHKLVLCVNLPPSLFYCWLVYHHPRC